MEREITELNVKLSDKHKNITILEQNWESVTKTIKDLQGKIDRQSNTIEDLKKSQSQYEDHDESFTQIEEQVDLQNKGMKDLQARLDAHARDIEEVEKQLTEIEEGMKPDGGDNEDKESSEKIDKLESQIREQMKRLDNVNGNVEQFKKQLEAKKVGESWRWRSLPRLIDVIASHEDSVRGIPIEPIKRYLRSPLWAVTGKVLSDEIEDRSYLTFLASFVDTDLAPRRLMVDLGLSFFGSSVGWFRENYPCHFHHIWGFEGVPGKFVLPPRDQIGADFYDSITYYEKYIDDHAEKDQVVNFTQWFLDTVKPTEEDFIVLKMDVEGAEWKLIPLLERTGLYKYIDEFFVEIHYYDEDIKYWHGFTHTRQETIDILKHWRNDLQVYMHFWP